MSRILGGLLCCTLVWVATSPSAQAQDPTATWVDLLEAGKIEEGRDQLVVYAGGLPPVEATKILRWVEAISLTEGADQATVARAIVLARRGQPGVALALVTEHLGERTDDAAPLLLSLAVRVADDADRPVEANALRARLVDEFFDHPVTPEALLDLAEYRIMRGEPLDATSEAVEALIIDQPTHPLVPTARRLLDRMRESGSASQDTRHAS